MAAFLQHGYLATTIRAVADAAGVDQALVLHYFGSKDGLFAAALCAGVPTGRLTALVDSGALSDLGIRLVRGYLSMWEDPDTFGRLRVILGAVSMSPSAAEMVVQFASEAVIQPMSAALGSSDAQLRANLAGSHLIGTAIARYLLKVEPLASLDSEQLVALVGPVVQHYLTGEIPSGSLSPG